MEAAWKQTNRQVRHQRSASRHRDVRTLFRSVIIELDDFDVLSAANKFHLVLIATTPKNTRDTSTEASENGPSS